MRLHGNRNRHGEKSNLKEPSGDPNELWSFGERIFEILKKLVFLRERLRPYIEHHMKIASEKGYPVMRPMFFDFLMIRNATLSVSSICLVMIFCLHRL